MQPGAMTEEVDDEGVYHGVARDTRRRRFKWVRVISPDLEGVLVSAAVREKNEEMRPLHRGEDKEAIP